MMHFVHAPVEVCEKPAFVSHGLVASPASFQRRLARPGDCRQIAERAAPSVYDVSPKCAMIAHIRSPSCFSPSLHPSGSGVFFCPQARLASPVSGSKKSLSGCPKNSDSALLCLAGATKVRLSTCAKVFMGIPVCWDTAAMVASTLRLAWRSIEHAPSRYILAPPFNKWYILNVHYRYFTGSSQAIDTKGSVRFFPTRQGGIAREREKPTAGIHPPLAGTEAQSGSNVDISREP